MTEYRNSQLDYHTQGNKKANTTFMRTRKPSGTQSDLDNFVKSMYQSSNVTPVKLQETLEGNAGLRIPTLKKNHSRRASVLKAPTIEISALRSRK